MKAKIIYFAVYFYILVFSSSFFLLFFNRLCLRYHMSGFTSFLFLCHKCFYICCIVHISLVFITPFSIFIICFNPPQHFSTLASTLFQTFREAALLFAARSKWLFQTIELESVRPTPTAPSRPFIIISQA